jgi:peptidoglycan hydrolase-like protein with peptidoglycan-binding domain
MIGILMIRITSYVATLVAILVIPLTGWAAFNDVTLTTDTVLSVGSRTITVSGSSALLTSITVNASDFSIDLQNGSEILVKATDGKTFTIDDSTYVVSSSCTTAETKLSIFSTASATTTVTITPNAARCDGTTESSSSSSSSSSVGAGSVGGGGGGSSSSVSTAPTPTPAPATVQVATVPAGVASAFFGKTLSQGMENEDVRVLQALLAGDPALYPEALVTGYYGRLTRAAVERFQARHGIVSSGSPSTTGYGLVGPRTRAKLNELIGTVPSPFLPLPPEPDTTPATVSTSASQPTTGGAFIVGLARGMQNLNVRRLQEFLNTDPSTQVSASGVGSAGAETDYFGTLTESAVQKFQMKHGIVARSDDPGYGYVGPKTRAKLNELFFSQ